MDGEPCMSLKDRLSQFMESQKKINEEVSSYLSNQQSVIQNLELQVGRIAQTLSGRTQGELPTQTQVNPKVDASKTVLMVDGVTTKKAWTDIYTKKYVPSDSESEPDYATDYDSEGIIVSFEHQLLHDLIYLSDEEEEDSKQGGYAEFMIPTSNKEKEKVDEEDTELTYVAPIKHDPGSYSLPISISNKFKGLALIDSGAALNMMPMSYCRKIGIKKLTPTAYQYRGINGYMTTPLGIAEAVPIRIGNFIYPTDFIIADLPKDTEHPIIFGRAFLHTAQVNIDMHNLSGCLEVEDVEIQPETQKLKNGDRSIFAFAKFQVSRRGRRRTASASTTTYRAPDGSHVFTYFMNDPQLSAPKRNELRDSMNRIASRQFVIPRRADWNLLQTLEVDNRVKAILKKHALGENGMEYYICKPWERVFEINESLYRKLILEFVATFVFNTTKATEECREQSEVDDPGFDKYMVATEKKPDGFNPRETWAILGDGDYSFNIKVKGLLSPVDRLLHRMLVHTVNSRSSSEEKIPTYDLWLLDRLTTNDRYPNAPYIIAAQLAKASGYREGSKMLVGQYVTRLAKHFDVLTVGALASLTNLGEMGLIDMDQLRGMGVVKSVPMSYGVRYW
ncbi:hypothetical protein OSB04_019037 [Centaurea solstitialis]|uniref:Peptidase A2 domain-containing protein n=1 Tax=Centaurea solstitialis TaxID=347529 RepID=A0AA38SPI8_9ASTR|nr:hypothetical protein OSB04_019037 [Centaurea solstitialis]